MVWLIVLPLIIGFFAMLILPYFMNLADACLDSGGSFNYHSCECDFEKNHEYKEDHQCK